MSGAGGKIAALAGASTAVAGTSPTRTHVRTLAASRFPVAPSRPRSTYPVLMHR
jgi:hypothetical protein